MGGVGSGISKRKKRIRRRGPDMLRGTDRRAAEVRSFLQRRAQIHSDLGDDPNLAAVMHSAIDRYVFLETRAMSIERTAMLGQPIDLNAYLGCVQTMIRLADRIGWQRRARRLPTALEYARTAAEAQPQ